jgi:hypothetical protein
MMFGLALVVIGAALELTKTWTASIEAERNFARSHNLPDEFWRDFMAARQQAMFGTAAPADEFTEGYLKRGDTRGVKIHLPKSECRFYFVAVKPPARSLVSIDDQTVEHRPMRDKEYYQTGRLCASDKGSTNAQISLNLENADSQFSIAAFVAPPKEIKVQLDAKETGPDQPKASEPAQAIRRVVCTGEFERACAGPHDLFIQCRPPPDPQIGAQVCTAMGRKNSTTNRLNTKGGNNCGYALIEVLCS